jgi:glycosyltransferase involved in cell wall biosynthesis
MAHLTNQPTVVHILNGLQFGGNETLCLQLLRHAPQKVHNTLLVLNSDHQEMLPLFQEIPGLSIVFHTASPYPRHQFTFSLYRKFQAWHPQAVLIYPFGIHPFAGVAARLARVPVVAVRAGNPPPPSGEAGRWKWRMLVAISWLLNVPVHGCSNATHQALATLMPMPPRSFAIPNGCDVAEVAQRATASRGKAKISNRLVIGMVARLNTIKDQATLIRAYGQLRQSYPQIELWLVGDGDERNRLENLCEHLGLSNLVKFLGRRSEIPELLGQMDIYAFSTTEDEGFGIALVEAMAASLPIVASDVAACREVLDDGDAGILVPPQDVDAMVKALEALIVSPHKREQWGQQAQARVLKHYSIQTCARRWYDLLLAQETHQN